MPSHLVGIGASAGGLEALKQLFRPMPIDSGMAFVIIQHQSPDFENLTAELLAHVTAIPIIVVDEAVEIRANHIYLSKPGHSLRVDDHHLMARDIPKSHGAPTTIDEFFRSLATHWADKSIAILLSGRGQDGAVGIMEVHNFGGLVLVQDASAAYKDMPRNAVATGCVDLRLAAEEMAQALLAYLNRAKVPADYRLPEQSPMEGVPAIFDALRKGYDIDFDFYKPQTITRRIQRRIALNPAHLSIEDYGRRIQQDPKELAQLYRDLLIGVTRFFRDPEAFAILADKVIPTIIKRLDEDEEARVWVCGCSTGEEAYSIAILFLEAFGKLGISPRLKVLATDTHRESLTFAAAGLYPSSAFMEMPDALRDKYFTAEEGGHFKVTAALRKPVIFSDHNVLKDPPFTRIDLISCRNLLIYLLPKAQARAIAFFLFSLKLDGYLLLGCSEGLGDLANQFRTVNQHWKIFAKVREDQHLVTLRSPLVYSRMSGTRKQLPRDPRLGRAYEALLDRFIPSGILVNDQREALHVFGDASRYLKPPTGRVTNELYYMTEGTLRSAIMSALRNAEQTRKAVTLKSIQWQTSEEVGGPIETLDVRVEPLTAEDSETPLYILLLKEQAPEQRPALPAPAVHDRAIEIDNHATSQILHLEQELQQAREALQSTFEELETNKEELQATNEELLASNEELQSANEELHSFNEELFSVNAEHEAKIQELNAVTNDLNNLIRSTNLATIFIDRDWNIRLFTPEALDVFPLVTSDTGRNLRNFQSLYPDPKLYEDIASVLADGQPIEKELDWADGRTLLRRIVSYHDLNHGQDLSGATLTYVDITEVVKARRALQTSERRLARSDDELRMIQAIANLGTWNWDLETNSIDWSDGCFKLFGYEPGSIVPTFDRFLERVVPGDKAKVQSAVDASIRDFLPYRIEYWITQPNGERRALLAEGQVELDGQGQSRYFTGTLLDITDVKTAEQTLRQMNQDLQQANAAKTAFLATISHEIRTPLNAIIGMGHLLGQTDLDKDQRAQVEAIELSSRNLLALINDVLDLSKIEAGELVLETEVFSLGELLAELQQIFVPIAASKGLELGFPTPDTELPTILEGDPLRLRQMLVNLLDNAFKFTEHGKVGLEVLRVSEETKGLRLRFVVRDTGIGIAPELRDRLFQPFNQGDASTTRRYGGSGLGLSIVRELSERMGGRVGLESDPKSGSTFWFEVVLRRAQLPTALEIQVQSKPVSDTDRALGLAGVSILVVDDNLMNLDVCRRILEKRGAKVFCVASGEGCIEFFRRSNDLPDLVLMDLRMPEMDGFDTTRLLRHELGLESLPIIALTAGTLVSERDRAIESGMNDFIAKPIEPHKLVQLIREFLGDTVPVSASGPSQPETDRALESDVEHDQWPEILCIDRDRARQLLQGQLDLFQELLRTYLEENAEVLPRVRAALEQGRRADAADILHHLRSSAAYIAATDIADQALILETELKEGGSRQLALLDLFEQAHRQLLQGIRDWAGQTEAPASTSDE